MDDEEIRRRYLSPPVKLRAYLQDVFGDLEEFRELYDELGGVDGIAAGLALKHRSELFKVLGSRHGILDRNEMASAANPVMAQVKERDIYRESKDTIHFDYSSPEALLEDGWVLD